MHHRKVFPVNCLNNIVASAGSRKFFGFKLLTYQVRDYYGAATRASIHEWLSDHDFLVFHIKRENLFSLAVSNIYARRRGAFHSTDKNSSLDMKVSIRPEEILYWMEGSRASMQFEERFLRGLNSITISYERDLASEDALSVTYRRILHVLGAEHSPLVIQNKKVTPINYSGFIMNYDEILDRIGSTEFGSYLPRPSCSV